MSDFSALIDSVSRHLRVSDRTAAHGAARQAVALAQTAPERATAQYWLARCHYVAGEIDVACGRAADAIDLAQQAGDAVRLGWARTLLARCLNAAGETQPALDHSLLALRDLDGVPDTAPGLAAARQAATIALGVVYLGIGDLPQALQWCQRAVDLARPLADQSVYGAALDTVACVCSAMAAEARSADTPALAEQHEREAIALSRQAVEVARRHGHQNHEASALLNLAESLTLVGEAPQALSLLQEWHRHHPVAAPPQQAHLLHSTALVHLALQCPAEALPCLERALEASDDQLQRTAIAEHLSLALERCGRWQEALVRYKEYHALHARVSAEKAQRSARVAALNLDVEHERARARVLASSNAELRQRARHMARMANEDPLTGLPNRRVVDARLAGPLANTWVAIVDVDHFKRINDTWSHAVGDEVLRTLGGLLRDNCRPSDTAARLGGEEFVVLYDGRPQADVAAAAERLRSCVAAHDWERLAHGLTVTVSVGLARATETTDGPSLLALADRRLYLAKNGGRNRIVSSG